MDPTCFVLCTVNSSLLAYTGYSSCRIPPCRDSQPGHVCLADRDKQTAILPFSASIRGIGDAAVGILMHLRPLSSPGTESTDVNGLGLPKTTTTTSTHARQRSTCFMLAVSNFATVLPQSNSTLHN
ncbi:hypothetical protein VTN77DRAFT_486 [Rasamsonia byssochlamydoides]|uniref:uncharacterized protein n=1 Tax=Rasamsonia byssochlamydoides TaxID=89139 RepID=UPI0037428EBC